MASSPVVYDLNPRAIAAGRIMAHELGIDDDTDTVICLNLLHHAGARFDNAEVAQVGWQAYATEWLELLRTKSRLVIFGLGLKGRKPVHWDVAPNDRARRFFDMPAKPDGPFSTTRTCRTFITDAAGPMECALDGASLQASGSMYSLIREASAR